jgi:CBS domain containing-hemolysin-like protein
MSRGQTFLTRLSDLEELAALRLESQAHEVDTLGGLVMHRLGRMPRVGDEIRLDAWVIRVEELDGRRASLLHMLRAIGPPAPVGTRGTA